MQYTVLLKQFDLKYLQLESSPHLVAEIDCPHDINDSTLSVKLTSNVHFPIFALIFLSFWM
jgi:hypothetical protein